MLIDRLFVEWNIKLDIFIELCYITNRTSYLIIFENWIIRGDNLNILPLKEMRENGNFTTISNNVLDDASISKDARFLYCILSRYYNEELEYSYPTRTHLAFTMGVTEKSVDKYIKELINLGLIEVVGYRKVGRFSNNVYKIYYYDSQREVKDTIVLTDNIEAGSLDGSNGGKFEESLDKTIS